MVTLLALLGGIVAVAFALDLADIRLSTAVWIIAALTAMMLARWREERKARSPVER